MISKRLIQRIVGWIIKTIFIYQPVYFLALANLTYMKFDFKMARISSVDFYVVVKLILVCQVTNETILLLILIQDRV